MKTIMGFFIGLRSILWPYADTPTAESVQDSLVATERQTIGQQTDEVDDPRNAAWAAANVASRQSRPQLSLPQ